MKLIHYSLLLPFFCIIGCTVVVKQHQSGVQLDSQSAVSLALAEKYLSMGQYLDAVKLASAVHRVLPDNLDAILLLALGNWKLERYQLSDSYFGKSLLVAPNHWRVNDAYASYLCARNKNLDDSMPFFQTALDVPDASDRAKVYANMGHCSALLAQTKDAVSYYRLALKNDNSVTDNYFYLATALLLNSEVEDSETAIEKYFEWGGRSRAAYSLALAIAQRLKKDKKVHFYQNILKNDKIGEF